VGGGGGKEGCEGVGGVGGGVSGVWGREGDGGGGGVGGEYSAPSVVVALSGVTGGFCVSPDQCVCYGVVGGGHQE